MIDELFQNILHFSASDTVEDPLHTADIEVESPLSAERIIFDFFQLLRVQLFGAAFDIPASHLHQREYGCACSVRAADRALWVGKPRLLSGECEDHVIVWQL